MPLTLLIIRHAEKPGEGVSQRPFETAVPLADRLFGASPDAIFAKGQEKDLVKKLLTLSGAVLVAWEHKAIIADILPLIPIRSGTPPTHWKRLARRRRAALRPGQRGDRLRLPRTLPNAPVGRFGQAARLEGEILGPQLDRLAVRRAVGGMIPGLVVARLLLGAGDAFLRDQPLQRLQPVPVIGLAGVGIA